MIKLIIAMLMGLCGVLVSTPASAGVVYKCVPTKNKPCPKKVYIIRSAPKLTEEVNTPPVGAIMGDWSLGLGGFILSVPGGPTAIGGEGIIIGDLKIADDLFFHLSASPGAAAVEDRPAFSLSEFAGLQARVGKFSFTGGARHRVTFLDGDNLNALLGEAQFRFSLGTNMILALSGGAGYGWFPIDEQVPGLFPAGHEPPTRTVIEGGWAWTGLLALENRF